MCGIVGTLSIEKNITNDELLLMTKNLSRRGPDDFGVFLEGWVGLGHARLSIIDIDLGCQPMYSVDKKIVLVFNGEIYNFKALKNELTLQGNKFLTNSDTEVLIIGYQVWGLDKVLEKIEGMFSFAMYDKGKNEVYIVRDRFGEKPLYYIDNETGIKFASELKALDNYINKESIDIKGLNYFLSLSYIPAPYTIYKGVKKLLPGRFIVVNSKCETKIRKYYDTDLSTLDKYKNSDFELAKNDLYKILSNSVKERMVSDVPIGAFLSGGIDSSIIASLMALHSYTPINTFSIGFKEKSYDESNRAELVADKIKSNHTVHFLDYNDVINLIDDIVLYFDEPFGDSSAIPSFYVARLARKDVAVVETGDCADELFGGYERYLAEYYKDKIIGLPKIVRKALFIIVETIPHTRLTDSLLRRIKKVINSVELSSFDSHYSMMCMGFNDKDRKSVLNDSNYSEIKSEIQDIYDSFNSKNVLEKSLYTDLKVVLEGDMLPKVDRVCMMNSLEARVPFLDRKIVEFAYKLPMDFKIKGSKKKYILREAFKDMLPTETISFRKKGFGVPVDYWLKNELKEDFGKLISKEIIQDQNIFNYSFLQSIFKEHLENKENHKGKLWNIYVFQKWYFKNCI